jgi:GYF domain 2
MADRWYYGRDEQRLGPFTPRQFKDLVDAGQIQPTDTVWKEGFADGVPAGKVKGLFDPLPAPGSAADAGAVSTAQASPAEDEAPAEETPPPARPRPPQPPPKKGRALGANGAILTSQDGTTVVYRKKCIKCGHLDTCTHRMPIRQGVTRTSFFCPKCKRLRPVEITGVL